VNYGSVPTDAQDLLKTSCPVVGSYGVKDRRLRGAAARLEAALTQNHIEHDVKEYPDAGHAFMNTAGRLVTARPAERGWFSPGFGC
jgi:carboxymethylenebutenolidase